MSKTPNLSKMETLANFLHFGDTPEYPGSTIRIQLKYIHDITMIFNETNAVDYFVIHIMTEVKAETQKQSLMEWEKNRKKIYTEIKNLI